MRLYEFTDPKNYIARTTNPKHCASQVERNGKADDAVPHPKSKPKTKKTGRSDKER